MKRNGDLRKEDEIRQRKKWDLHCSYEKLFVLMRLIDSVPLPANKE
jgi:hypothetical protein